MYFKPAQEIYCFPVAFFYHAVRNFELYYWDCFGENKKPSTFKLFYPFDPCSLILEIKESSNVFFNFLSAF